jgi:hypothetical protein
MVVAILLLEILLGHYVLGVGVNHFSFKDGTFFSYELINVDGPSTIDCGLWWG